MAIMKIGVSSLAWESALDNPGHYKWLACLGVKVVEIALPRHIGSWSSPALSRLFSFIEALNQASINVVSAQAIYFNSGVVSLDSQEALAHFKKVSNLCATAGIQKLVLGAPTLRQGLLGPLVEKLNRYNDIAAFNSQVILLEPNSRVYKGNYYFTVGEIVETLKTGQYSNIKTMVDTHNILLENQTPAEVYLQYRDYIDHIHVSEVNLQVFESSNAHLELANTLQKSNYQGLVVYETKPSVNYFTGTEEFIKVYNI